jgi:hypothetical protein
MNDVCVLKYAQGHYVRFPRSQAKQCHKCGQQVIEHYAETAPQFSVIVSYGRWFDDIEQAK